RFDDAPKAIRRLRGLDDVPTLEPEPPHEQLVAVLRVEEVLPIRGRLALKGVCDASLHDVCWLLCFGPGRYCDGDRYCGRDRCCVRHPCCVGGGLEPARPPAVRARHRGYWAPRSASSNFPSGIREAARRMTWLATWLRQSYWIAK